MRPGRRAWPAPAAAKPSRPKLAALILKTGTVDEELADNLTEVLISRLARRGDHDIAGKEELKTKLGVDDNAAADCMSEPRLPRPRRHRARRHHAWSSARSASAATTTSTISNLIDIETGKVENRVFELVAGGKVDPLDRRRAVDRRQAVRAQGRAGRACA